MNTALLLSGGTGGRIPSNVPKQYLRIGDRMLITYALEPVLASPMIDFVEIVAGRKWRELIWKDAKQVGLPVGKISGFTDPGENRQNSILNGLQSILYSPGRIQREGKKDKDKDTDTVLIHDAARPCVTRELIHACYQAFPGHDGVMPVLPVKDTMYLSSNGSRVEGLLERSHIFAGQAPELFHLGKYYRANMALMPEQLFRVSGSAEPAAMAGMDIAMIPGDEKNFKITTETDLQKFRAIF